MYGRQSVHFRQYMNATSPHLRFRVQFELGLRNDQILCPHSMCNRCMDIHGQVRPMHPTQILGVHVPCRFNIRS